MLRGFSQDSGNSLSRADSPEMLSPVFRGSVQLMLSLCGQGQGSWWGGERLVVWRNVNGIAWQWGVDSLQGPQAGEDQDLNQIKINHDFCFKK